MVNSTSLIGECFEGYIEQQVRSGRFSSHSKIMREALRLFEKEEYKKERLLNELKVGEISEMLTDFDRKQALSMIHAKYYNEI